MANVIMTFRIMPKNINIDLSELGKKATKLITQFGGEVGKKEEVPVAFGLKSLNLIFVMDENKGSTEELEKQIQGLKGVTSVEVTDVRRAIG